MTRKEVRVGSDSLEQGYVVIASEEDVDVPSGNFEISGRELYRTDDDSLAHDLFAPGRVLYYESLGYQIKTLFIILSKALMGKLGQEREE